MTTATRTTGGDVGNATLEEFCDHLLLGNPFLNNRVGQNAVAEADVPVVNQRQSNELVNLARMASRQSAGIGAVVWGEAGVGKSHLLARLAKWAAGTDKPQAHLVYVSNLQAAPEHLPKSLLRCVMSLLTQGRTDRFETTPLGHLVHRALLQSLGVLATQQITWDAVKKSYGEYIATIASNGPGQAGVIDRRVFDVLFQLFRSSYRASQKKEDGKIASDAVRWITGDSLDAKELASLGLGFQGTEDEPEPLDNQHAFHVIAALCHIAAIQNRPLILCVDQVENLSPEQFGVLGRFLHSLLDAAPNLLVVLSGVRQTVQEWLDARVIQHATWERLKQFQITLQRVTPDQAIQILRARLEPYLEGYVAVEPIRACLERDTLFPIATANANKRFDRPDLRPRDVINWARDQWVVEQESLQSKGIHRWLQEWPEAKVPPPTPTPPPLPVEELIDAKVSLKLQELREQRRLDPQTLPPDAENMAGLIHCVLEHSLRDQNDRAITLDRVPIAGSRTYHLFLNQTAEGSATRTGILCVVTANRTSMTGSLRRLKDDRTPPNRLIVVTDERQKLDVVGKGKEYLAALNAQYPDNIVQMMTFDEYAELDALAGVVGLARSGDLEIEHHAGSRGVSERETIASLQRLNKYKSHRLVQKMLSISGSGTDGDTSENGKPQPTSDKDLIEFILGRVAMTCGATTVELAILYSKALEQLKLPRPSKSLQPEIERVARDLHQSGKVHASPCDGYLFVMRK